jgi:hypothetical protein
MCDRIAGLQHRHPGKSEPRQLLLLRDPGVVCAGGPPHASRLAIPADVQIEAVPQTCLQVSCSYLTTSLGLVIQVLSQAAEQPHLISELQPVHCRTATPAEVVANVMCLPAGDHVCQQPAEADKVSGRLKLHGCTGPCCSAMHDNGHAPGVPTVLQSTWTDIASLSCCSAAARDWLSPVWF